MNLLQQAGAQPQRQPKYVPLFVDRMFTGIWTQRTPLHDPSDVVTSKFYGGRPDALWDGLNVELTNRLTLQRRPGLSALSAAIYPTAPLRAFSFQLTNGSIQLIIDTGSTGNLVLSAVANSSGGTAVYTGVFPNGGSNAYVGMIFQVAGFTGVVNNGTYTATASSTTTLTLTNATATAESHAATAVSTGAVWYDQQNGSKTSIFAKSPGAGQTYFVAVNGILYMGDGVDTHEYTPGNTNGVLWNWGIAAPAVPPTVTIVESGNAAAAWRANTVWSTMGLIFDSGTNTIQQLISVNASTTNTTRFGTSGNGQPAWNQTPGATTSDGTITWTNNGPIVAWTANTLYNNASVGGTTAAPCIIYDPVTKSLYFQANASLATGVSGAKYPTFIPAQGALTHDGTIQWRYCGGPNTTGAFNFGTWQASHVYPAIGTVTQNDAVSSVCEPIGLQNGLPTNVTVYWQTSNGGTSGTGGTSPKWSTVPGVQTGGDGDLIWMSLGTDAWAATTQVSQWTTSGAIFSAIKDSNGNFQVCTQTGITGSGSHPTWSTGYGQITKDGTTVWTCVGADQQWAASTIWYLPIVGFSPPSSSSPYGGASIIDSNGDVEYVISSGKGGSTTPSWSGINQTTTDNAATWYNLSVFSANSLAFSAGYAWAYSYKARSLTDFYSVSVNGALPVPPGLTNALPAPTGSETEDISTASSPFVITGNNTGAVMTVSGIGSTNPAVDTIVIWRSADGGGADNMFELTEIPAPPPIGGIAQPWSFKDFLPDIPTTINGVTYPGLDNLIPAPIDHQNDPPLSAFLPMVYNFERIWGAVGSTVYFSGGPDVLAGNPNSAFDPADLFQFLAGVTALVQSTQGLVTFLTDSIQLIAGGPATDQFYVVPAAAGVGCLNFNAIDKYVGEIFFFSSDSQLMTFSPNLQLAALGIPLGDKFAAWNSSIVQVAVQQSGIDNCFMVSDGSTGWYRCNPRQFPGIANGPEPIWSPFAAITGGCQMVQSIETAPGIKTLLVGSPNGGQPILKRNLSVYTDNGTQYDAFFTMGSIVLCHPGQLAVLKFIEADFSGFQYKPTVSYLLNEIAGTFVPFVLNPVFDPPSLYGTLFSPQSYSPLRFYFNGNASLGRCRHLQIKIDLGTTSVGNEMFNLTIFGRLLTEQ